MEIKLPSDCGNSPRISIVGDFAVNWATGNRQAVAAWLADDASWALIGRSTYSGPAAAEMVIAPFTAERVEITSVVTHGRLASCDGYLQAKGRRVDFSHVIRFASTSKTAKIAELRSYCIDSQRE